MSSQDQSLQQVQKLLGERIKTLRIQREWPQNTLAELAGMTSYKLSQIEHRNPFAPAIHASNRIFHRKPHRHIIERNKFVMKQQRPGHNVLLKSFGIQIRDLRTQKNWSLVNLAQASGVSANHLGQIERGKVDLSTGTAAKITQALGTTISDLLNGVA
jgi:transcriptional regulator with XRE-family HTH domain